MQDSPKAIVPALIETTCFLLHAADAYAWPVLDEVLSREFADVVQRNSLLSISNFILELGLLNPDWTELVDHFKHRATTYAAILVNQDSTKERIFFDDVVTEFSGIVSGVSQLDVSDFVTKLAFR